MSIKHAPPEKKTAPPAEAGYAATEGAPDLETVGCDVDDWMFSPTLVCGERQQEQEQGDLHFLGESKGQLENWYYLAS